MGLAMPETAASAPKVGRKFANFLEFINSGEEKGIFYD
jgi:hypothetical protein